MAFSHAHITCFTVCVLHFQSSGLGLLAVWVQNRTDTVAGQVHQNILVILFTVLILGHFIHIMEHN